MIVLKLKPIVHLNSPGLGIRVVWPSENHKGNWRSSSWVVAWKQVAISLCGALQFSFFLMIFLTCSAFRFQPSVGTSGTRSSIASLTSSIHSAFVSPLPFSSHRLFRKLHASSMLVNVWLLTCVPYVTLSHFGLSISAWLSNIFPKVASILPGSAWNFWLIFLASSNLFTRQKVLFSLRNFDFSFSM